jgi:hypothetical protein
LIAYIILAIIVPEEPVGNETPSAPQPPATVEVEEPEAGESE